MPALSKQTTWTPETIFLAIKGVLMEALGLDDDDFAQSTKKPLDMLFMDDLGGESIDILDIAFRLERTFSIKLSSSDFHPHTLSRFKDMQLSGELTPEILEAAQQKFPTITNWNYVQPKISTIGDLITVRLFCVVIAKKLEVQWVDPT